MSLSETTALLPKIIDQTTYQEATQAAYQNKDAEASHYAHELRGTLNISPEAPGGRATDYLKSIVFGGLDGIVTTFNTVSSVAGARLDPLTIVILGVAHLFSDSISMGLGDWLSSQAEVDYIQKQRKKEAWELMSHPNDEITEMVDIFMGKGIPRPDSELIVNTLVKYPEPFLDVMMVMELNLMPTGEAENAAVGGLVTMLSFILFGAVPLIPFLAAFLPGVSINYHSQLVIAVFSTMVTLFLLGAIKGRLVEPGDSQWWKSGLMMLVNGSLAASVAYGIGVGMGDLTEGYS